MTESTSVSAVIIHRILIPSQKAYQKPAKTSETMT